MENYPYPKQYLYRRVVQAKLFIDEHYDKELDLSQISDEAAFSKFHFIRLFSKIYGKTPHQYLITVRIEKAMQLLRAEVPVWDTCTLVGFESLGSFSSLFKKIVGISPSAYLEQQREWRVLLREKPLDYIPGCFAEKRGWTKAILKKQSGK